MVCSIKLHEIDNT